MESRPSFVRYEQNGIGLVFDLRREVAELAYVGNCLPTSEDLTALCNAMRRGRHASRADRPVPRSIMPQAGWGNDAPPGIVLLGPNGPLNLRLELEDVIQSPHGLRFVHRDAVYGLRLDVIWLIKDTGLVQTQAELTNSTAHTLVVV
jgi:hypothetical protein